SIGLLLRIPPSRSALPPTRRALRRTGRWASLPIPPIQPLRRQLFFIWRSTARLGDVFLLDAIDVELLRAGDDLVERLVEVEGARLLEARVVHARDYERFEIGTREPFRFQLLDRSAHRIVQL